jgi:hypothetical protein
MADDTVLLSTLSENETWSTGWLLTPYSVWVELNVVKLIVCFTTLKLEEGGVGGGGSEEVDVFLH